MTDSRTETILSVILGDTDPSELAPPKSRVEAQLIELLVKIKQLSDLAGTLKIHICTAEEYDPLTGWPDIADPDENTFYLVPSGSSEDDMFVEWIWKANHWERFGSEGAITIPQSDWAQDDPTAPDYIKNKPDDIGGGKTYTFAEGNVDGAFSVTPEDEETQSVKIHGLRSFCFGSDEDDDEIILYSESAEDMLAEAEAANAPGV